MANAYKHGIGFEEALTVFTDTYHLILQNSVRTEAEEQRYQIIGEMDSRAITPSRRIVTVTFTIRQEGDVYRLISARPASRSEGKRYERQI